MAQFDVHRNTDARSRRLYPYLIDLQTHLLRHSERRLVAPLVLKDQLPAAPIIHPELIVEDRILIVSSLELFSIPRSILGPVVTSLTA